LQPLALAASMLVTLPVAADAAVADGEAQLDSGLKAFGYLAGLSRGCVADGQVDELEREVLELHGAVGRLLGTDRAFLFAAAFGYGSSVLTSTADCESVLRRYEAQVGAFRSGRGERP
jgi:hypothetical protein